ncbi:MAG: hypothetical protein WBC13_00875 [Dokdonella sp.]
MNEQQPMTAQEAMQRQAHLLLQVGDLSMQLEQKRAEFDALRNRLLLTRLELAQMLGYTQGLAQSAQAPEQAPEQAPTKRAKAV